MKIDRLLGITIYLLNHGKTSAGKLARQFELDNLLDMENRKSPEENPEEQKTETQNLAEQSGQVPHVAEQPYRYGAGREENR